jgi:uncharacterized protein (DUF58 family)
MNQHIETFNYRVYNPGYSVYSGAHPGKVVGNGQLFKLHEPLLASPDPRRIDLRASLFNPFQQYQVRVFKQHSKLNVYVIADLSTSMHTKLPTLGKFILSAAQSALQLGDNFGFIGCGPRLDHQWLLPAEKSIQPIRELVNRLMIFRTENTGDSLSKISAVLPEKRCLLFLISDFHFSTNRLQQILQPLTQHTVVPLVCWDPVEYTDLPNWGLVRFKDAEKQQSRILIMRPMLKQRIIQAFEERCEHLKHSFRAVGMEPLFLHTTYQTETLSRYFQQQIL